MSVVVCPVGHTLILECHWPAAARVLTGAAGLAQVRATASAASALLIDATVAITTSGGDFGNGYITITLAAADTLDMDEGARGFMDLRLYWSADGEVQYPLADDLVEIEFTATVTRAA